MANRTWDYWTERKLGMLAAYLAACLSVRGARGKLGVPAGAGGPSCCICPVSS
jgi:hypothetical protein